MAYTTIKKPSDYFNTKLYTGNGSTNAITGVGFQPDLTWLKVRLAGSGQDHTWYDSVRGATKFIESNTTNAEATGSNYLTSFDSDGFTLGNDQSHVNASGDSYASWNWLAGGTASSNTDGSITSNVSANTTSGFSIVSYTGTSSDNATVGHGLGVIPSVVIFKRRDSTSNWCVIGNNIGTAYTNFLELDGTGAFGSNTTILKSATSSTTLTLGTNARSNPSSGTMVAYCFAEKKGFSKFGKFSGTTGEEFVYTGFKPAFVMLKRTNTTSDWYMFDNKRNTYNLSTKALDANTSDTEATYGSGLDLLSNGFVDKSFLADNGNELIYMAFAEEPLVGDNPATAR